MRRLDDLHAALAERHLGVLGFAPGPGLAGDGLRRRVQDHGMKGVAAVDRQQPVRPPDLGRQPEPDELVRLAELFGHLVLERRRREFRLVAEIGPDISAQLLRRISRDRGPASLVVVLLLPRNHDAAPVAVEAKAVQDALQVAVEHPAHRQLDAAMRTAIAHDAGFPLRIPPSHQRLAQNHKADRLSGGQLFRLQDRVPVVPQALREILPANWVPRPRSHDRGRPIVSRPWVRASTMRV